MPRLNQADRQRFASLREHKAALADRFKTLGVMERLAYIPRDGDVSEFEIQSFLFEQLKRLGFHVRGEVTTKCGSCVFDLVVFDDHQPIRVIEVKKGRRPSGFVSKAGKRMAMQKRNDQLERYRLFGAQVDLVCSIEAAKQYIETVRKVGFSFTV